MIRSTKRPARITADMLDRNKLPIHIAIIMDGNGRWAGKRGLPRIAGHHAGVRTVERITESATELGIRFLTLYTFSRENWNRPILEVKALMEILHANLISQRERLLKNGVRLRISGDLHQFPESVVQELECTMSETASGQNLTLNLALGYSGREEILAATRSLMRDAMNGKIDPDAVTEQIFSDRLLTAGLPDPELIIRTSGEYRLSNFLLWQCSYSEFFFTDVLWPDFAPQDLIRAIYEYQHRDRRFGKVSGGAPTR